MTAIFLWDVFPPLGLISAETSGHPAAWHRSEYLQQQYQELKDVLQDTTKPVKQILLRF